MKCENYCATCKKKRLAVSSVHGSSKSKETGGSFTSQKRPTTEFGERSVSPGCSCSKKKGSRKFLRMSTRVKKQAALHAWKLKISPRTLVRTNHSAHCAFFLGICHFIVVFFVAVSITAATYLRDRTLYQLARQLSQSLFNQSHG